MAFFIYHAGGRNTAFGEYFRRFSDSVTVQINFFFQIKDSGGFFINQNYLLIKRVSGIAKWRLTDKSSAFLFHAFDTFYLPTCIFYMTFIIPCFNAYYIIIRVKGIIIIINQNNAFSHFLHFFKKEQYLRIVSADTG